MRRSGSPPSPPRSCCTACTAPPPEHQARREAFVEAVLAAFPPLPYGLLAARAHARIWAGLSAAGHDVGAHDRLVAATAITAGWRVGTANLRHFDRIPGLDTLTVTFTG